MGDEHCQNGTLIISLKGLHGGVVDGGGEMHC